ncbi:unnamed protein product [Parajaminaea phylloscopi]
MVCAKCEKKLSKPAAADPFRNRDATGSLVASSSAAPKSGIAGPKATNKLLSSKSLSSNRFNPLGSSASKCKICQSATPTSSVRGATYQYCANCAYKRGVCAMCGKMVLESKQKAGMKMSS